MMAGRSRIHQEAYGEADSKEKMCTELKSAIESEGSAQTEYQDLQKAAEDSGNELFAETVNQIENQEASHQNIFTKAHDMYCKD